MIETIRSKRKDFKDIKKERKGGYGNKGVEMDWKIREERNERKEDDRQEMIGLITGEEIKRREEGRFSKLCSGNEWKE